MKSVGRLLERLYAGVCEAHSCSFRHFRGNVYFFDKLREISISYNSQFRYGYIVNDIINVCFRLLPKPYTGAFAEPKETFVISLAMEEYRIEK